MLFQNILINLLFKTLILNVFSLPHTTRLMAEARAPAGAGHPVLWGGRNTVPSSQDHLAVVHAD